MYMDSMTLWLAALSLLLTIIGALVGFIVSNFGQRLNRIEADASSQWDVINHTRQEVAKEYVTKAEVHNDIQRVLDSVSQLNDKIDRFIQIEMNK